MKTVPSELREVPSGIVVVAQNRTRHLHRRAVMVPVEQLLRDAYIQGMTDAFDAALTPEGRKALS